MRKSARPRQPVPRASHDLPARACCAATNIRCGRPISTGRCCLPPLQLLPVDLPARQTGQGNPPRCAVLGDDDRPHHGRARKRNLRQVGWGYRLYRHRNGRVAYLRSAIPRRPPPRATSPSPNWSWTPGSSNTATMDARRMNRCFRNSSRKAPSRAAAYRSAAVLPIPQEDRRVSRRHRFSCVSRQRGNRAAQP